ncbi:monophenol monooxygenase (tyrosinase) [Teratosphaeria destructans]|uniref:Monophenol monooxygenase (Tyrosinase) n=1 Tax=Teratosphaeria destructans TaxID=418781 RepID=A0A9W7T0I7_9PEZI|nr:monophenol monooxygenase (tyrosinase) [Teratosphaeria destructans]
MFAGTSLYDDFSYVHGLLASYVHYRGVFLPFHRLMIHTLEATLQQTCGYNGSLPYWDWTLDHEDLAKSPVWDPIRGFGGNGVPQEDGSSCVTDGPFGNSTRHWTGKHDTLYGVERDPHCLSRKFEVGASVATLQFSISPTVVKSTLDQAEYGDFFYLLETNPHNAIPQLVRGDFLMFTAPNDPLFYLHHGQLDRLWWVWQMRDAKRRLEVPSNLIDNGAVSGGDKINASFNSGGLPLQGLAEDRRLEDVMDTQGGLLCYTYDS